MTKLLVIDDDQPVLETLKISLTSEGYEVMTAETGSEGLTIFEQQSPKIVLMSPKISGTDGIELLKRIKAIDPEAEVIVITGHSDMGSAIAALQHGVSDFITKPIHNELLMLSLERAKKKMAMSQHTRNLEQKVQECTMELRQVQDELTKNKRVATIGEGVAQLAHYMKNILTALRGGVYMVNTGMAKDKPRMLKDGWEMVRRNIEKVSDLVFNILRYSKERRPERSVCSPNEIVSKAVELFRERAAEHHVKLNMLLDPDLKEAYVDRDGIHNVLTNLISNAIDACIYDTATSKAWVVTVTTELVSDTKFGEVIFLEVTDNGTGITDAVKAKLFTRFFSTKGGRGTGLGLLSTQKIIDEHGGEISVQSKAGQGATFSVRLNRVMPKENAGAPHGPEKDAEA